ncbi:4Fe-4S binding protein [Sulfurimonas sp.]|uniref:4Fe-4S binding protein n=1 Tax=Sulfurimonas sp. TaxID=2022749 RepID=UPI003569E352
MGSMTFVQNSELFSYSGTNCVRNDYYHNECQLCVDICPERAFHIVRSKLTLFSSECIECAACIGSCPTEALSIKSFDPNAYTTSFKEEDDKLLSCKKTTSCLGSFDSHHYITMALTSNESPICDMAHCKECSLNTNGKIESFIREEIKKTMDFLTACDSEYSISIQEEKPEDENAKRALFKAAFTKVKEAVQEEDEQESIGITLEYQKASGFTGLPLKFLNLKKAIRDNISKLPKTTHDTNFGIFANKEISFKDCTNCGDCVNFCPTEALLKTTDKQGINFNVGNCISCGICNHICKTDAIKTTGGIDLVNFAYDRGTELVHYEMVMCHECRCPYPYRGGDPICDRCADFRVDFSHVFTLAKDM